MDVRSGEAIRSARSTGHHTNTCASWASDTAYRVTGERVNASELGGLTDTPREIRESIDKLERQQSTSREAPREPVDVPKDRGSSSSSLSMEEGRDPQVNALLANAGDPERLQQALERLQESARGQAFADRAAEHTAQLNSAEQARGQMDHSVKRCAAA